MIRRRQPSAPRARPARHGRHGRQGRSPVVRPPLPPLLARDERFEMAVGTAAEFLQSAWPELRDVSFQTAALPLEPDEDGIPRWQIDRAARRIVLYRIPIERLDAHGIGDDVRMGAAVEATVFRAAAEYLGRDPWDLAPDRFRFL